MTEHETDYKVDWSKITAYLSGPMQHILDFNFPAFFAAEEQLYDLGVGNVLNPARHGTRLPRHVLLRRDVKMVAEADVIVLLPGWENSQGACLELAIARELGMPALNTDLSPADLSPTLGCITHLEFETNRFLYSGKPLQQYTGVTQQFDIIRTA